MGKLRRAAIGLALLVGAGVALIPTVGHATPPTPDPGFLSSQVPASKCAPDNSYEKAFWSRTEGSYGAACRRLHFAYGPIHVKPGQNDVLIGPVTIEKPAYDGYVVRIKPDLVDQTGKAPPIISVHLHHATWLNGYPSYGNGPFFAAGEEKTIATFPKGYGMHVGASDTWLLLYMVHNLTAEPKTVWITYDVDYIADAAATKLHIDPVKPIWLDVQHDPITATAPNRSSYPVFNVDQGFGHYDPRFHRTVCVWPSENCARHDAYGDRTPQQGKPAQVAGADWVVPKDLAGTLVGLGGHLHPGGLEDQVSLVRDGAEKRIFDSDAVYWRRHDPTKAGGPIDSWDVAMTVTGAPNDWKVKIKPGDVIRLNAVYDTKESSWYENMGIVVALVATHDTHGPPGVDVFDDHVRIDPGVPTTAVPVPGWRQPSCHPSLTGPNKVLCLGGQVTHGHLPEASDFGGCAWGGCQPLPTTKGPQVSDVSIANFTYGVADLGLAYADGVPQVKEGQPLTFWNADTGADVWHTVTRCAAPCTGPTGLNYPVADGGPGAMNFDSSEIGYGLMFTPAKGQIWYDQNPEQSVWNGAKWTLTPTQPGVYTFFCRIHPSMRGVIRVVK